VPLQVRLVHVDRCCSIPGVHSQNLSGCHLSEPLDSVAAVRRVSWLGCSPVTNLNKADHVRIM
jgi:hypothetical protein